jgi:ribonucleoside-diphosphate reductase alpha chain
LLTTKPTTGERLLDIFGNQRFLPGGRIQSAIGSKKETTAYNCFVSGTIDDSFVDGNGSIMNRLTEAATTMRMGGGIGYNFSTLRPSQGPDQEAAVSTAAADLVHEHLRCQRPVLLVGGPPARGADGRPERVTTRTSRRSSRPSSRRRRPGAGRMLDEMSPADPQYWPLHNALQATLRLKGFNISVALTDEFMEAVVAGKRTFPLRFGGKVVPGHQPARALGELMRRRGPGPSLVPCSSTRSTG